MMDASQPFVVDPMPEPPSPGEPVLFESPEFVARVLGSDDLPALQALFDENPDYFIAINGLPARPDDAQRELDELPPPELAFGGRWVAGLHERGTGRLAGVVNVLSDFMAPGVWHVGLLFVATRWHGSGAAQRAYRALERWMQHGGATWLRLGVVDGNRRAERFWARQGFTEVRQRTGVDTGGRLNTVRVLLKPLAVDSDLAAYLAAVPRDRPDSELP
jgi:RimJ/RimL family protein N-acetyltransferase